MSDSPVDPAHSLAGLFAAGQELMQKFAAGLPGAAGLSGAAESSAEPAATFMTMMNSMAESQQTYLTEMNRLWLAMLSGAAPGAGPAEDKRFAAEPWRAMPGFDLIKRTYLAYAEALQASVDTVPADAKTKAQMRFAMRQLSDALSPANFFATNPEAMQLAQATGGKSVADGMVLFFQDLAKGRITITDESAFEVGRNLAVTPGAVVFENDLIQVLQYAPRTPTVCRRPLVIIPPAINKFYILDLQPHNSLVAYAVEQGHTVFLVSWRNINPRLGSFTWDDYLQMGVIRAIDVAQEVSGADRVNALGFCVGGTLLGCAAAVMKREGEDKIASLTLLTSMLDFSDTGEIGLLVSEQSVALREASLGRGGVMDGKELAFVFSSLRANDLIWPYVVNRYLKGKRAPAFDLLYWNSDGTNLPGPMFCWYLRNTYLENNVSKRGRTMQCGAPLDLSQVDVPAYLYASREDHIVPWQTAYQSTRLLSGDTTFVLGASGHVAGVVNPPANKKRNYWTNAVDSRGAEQWFAAAHKVPGSWWPHWAEWLKAWGGADVPARTALGSAAYPVIEPAPGRYVAERSS